MKSLHASGEWNRPDSGVRMGVEAWVAQGADFLSHTEVRLHLDALKTFTTMRLCRGTGTDGQPECALQVRNDRWRVVSVETVRLSTLVIPRRKARCYALHVIVEDRKTGQRHHRLVVHMPSGVDGLRGLKNNAQGKVYRSALVGLAAYVDELDGPVVITGDWNLHLRKKWVRALLAKHFPDFAHTPLTAKGGTHGKRFIDFSLARGIDLSDPRIVPNPASDHRALAEHQEITVKDQTYPKADTTTQWFQSRYPGSSMDANCGVLHTTESTDWPGYNGGATAPNVTAKPNIPAKRLLWRQHFDMDRSSRALQNDAGGVETNTLNVAQVELVGTCDPAHRTSWGKMRAGVDYIYWPDAPDWALAALAEFLRWCDTEHGIPLAGAQVWLVYPASYGQSNPNRFTFAQWRALKLVWSPARARERPR